jgi:hypothetical protein
LGARAAGLRIVFSFCGSRAQGLFSLSRFSRRRCGVVAPRESLHRVESRVAGVVVRSFLRLAKRFSVSPPASALSESLLHPDNCAAGSVFCSVLIRGPFLGSINCHRFFTGSSRFELRRDASPRCLRR